jgi:hypothetical protein
MLWSTDTAWQNLLKNITAFAKNVVYLMWPAHEFSSPEFYFLSCEII